MAAEPFVPFRLSSTQSDSVSTDPGGRPREGDAEAVPGRCVPITWQRRRPGPRTLTESHSDPPAIPLLYTQEIFAPIPGAGHNGVGFVFPLRRTHPPPRSKIQGSRPHMTPSPYPPPLRHQTSSRRGWRRMTSGSWSGTRPAPCCSSAARRGACPLGKGGRAGPVMVLGRQPMAFSLQVQCISFDLKTPSCYLLCTKSIYLEATVSQVQEKVFFWKVHSISQPVLVTVVSLPTRKWPFEEFRIPPCYPPRPTC